MNLGTILYVIFSLYLFTVIQLKLGINTLFSVLALFFSLIFLLDDTYLFFALIQLYLLRRYIIIYDNYISTLFLILAGLVILTKKIIDEINFKNNKYTIFQILFLFTVILSEVSVIFIDLNYNINISESIKSFLFFLIYLIISLYIISDKNNEPLISQNKNINIVRTLSLFGPLLTYFVFYVFNAQVFTRDIYLEDILLATTESYTRIDPNFLSVDFLLLSLLFFNRQGKKMFFFILTFILFNSFYLFSTTGFVLSFIIVYFLLSNIKQQSKRIMFKIILLICGIFLSIFIWNIKYLPIQQTEESILNFLLSGRITTWKAYVSSIFDRPFFGYGSYSIINVSHYLGFVHYAHNAYLQNFAENGVIYSSFLYSIIFYSATKYKSKNALFVFILWALSSFVLSYWDSIVNVLCIIYILSTPKKE